MVVVACSAAEPPGTQVATITEWLASLGMSEYAQRFADDRIDDVSIHPARMAASNSSGWEDDRKG
jgi:hypothetical protein